MSDKWPGSASDGEGRDPLSHVRVPDSSAPRQEKEGAQVKHVAEARAFAPRLFGRTDPLPPSLQAVVDRVCSLGPAGVQEVRDRELGHLREVLAAARGRSRAAFQRAPSHCCAVSRAASRHGLNPVLLREYLDRVGW